MASIVFDNPFSAPGRWWKGNLHTHTTASDGELSPPQAAARYRALGYDFLALTDHLVVSEPLDAPEGLLIVPGAEYHTWAGNPERFWHFVSLGTKRPIAGALGPVEALAAGIRENSEYWWVAHPKWSNLAETDALDVDGLPALEVYNGACERARERGDSEAVWDYALAAGRRLNALSVDDTHAGAEVGLGWTMLRASAERLDLGAVWEALRRGHWYSTNGPLIHDVRVDGNVVSAWTSPARAITFVARSPDGRRFYSDDGALVDRAEYEIKGTETYLRVQVEDAEGRRAFSNPLYVEAAGEKKGGAA